MGAPLTSKFPPTKGIRWFNLLVLIITPLVACYGFWATELKWNTGIFSGMYYVFSMLGEA